MSQLLFFHVLLILCLKFAAWSALICRWSCKSTVLSVFLPWHPDNVGTKFFHQALVGCCVEGTTFVDSDFLDSMDFKMEFLAVDFWSIMRFVGA